MKTQMHTVFIGLLVAGSTLAAFAEEQLQGPYVGGDLGMALTDDVKLRQFPGASGNGKVEFDPGVRLSLNGGWRFNNWFRAGGEFGIISHTIDGADAAMSQMPLLANVEFQLPNRSRILPFIGGGPGFSVSVIDIDDDFLNDGDFVDGSAADAVFAWQAYAGVRFRINGSMSVGAVYKYFEADESSWDVENSSSDIRFGRTKTHSFSASFSMDF